MSNKKNNVICIVLSNANASKALKCYGKIIRCFTKKSRLNSFNSLSLTDEMKKIDQCPVTFNMDMLLDQYRMCQTIRYSFSTPRDLDNVSQNIQWPDSNVDWLVPTSILRSIVESNDFIIIADRSLFSEHPYHISVFWTMLCNDNIIGMEIFLSSATKDYQSLHATELYGCLSFFVTLNEVVVRHKITFSTIKVNFGSDCASLLVVASINHLVTLMPIKLFF